MRIGLSLVAVVITLAAAPQRVQSKRDVAPCHGQLRFLKPTSQGVNSVQFEYGLRLRNTSHQACVAPRFLVVEVPPKTAAPIDVQPQLHQSGDPATVASLAPALVVQPGKIVEASAVLTTPCGHRITNVAAKIVFVVDEWPVYPKTSITTDLCPALANTVDLYPLRHS